MLKFRACTLLFTLSSCLFTVTARAEDQLPNPTDHALSEGQVFFNPNDLRNEKDWKRLYFDVVIVINKAKNAQTIDVYRFGRLVKTSRVSTGREQVERHIPGNPKTPKRTYFSQTSTGYFTATKLDIDHVSTTWANSFMPWAVFFNGGIATHRSPHENVAKNVIDHHIGKRASGGCVRLHEQDAKDLFWIVRASGGPYTQAELRKRQFAQEAGEAMQMNLVPYGEDQVVPDVDPKGGLAKDPATGQITTHWGVRTLYVVENIPL